MENTKDKYYIITTPFIDRPLTHRIWLRHFERLQIPKERCLILWYDISGRNVIKHQLLRWIEKHKNEYFGFKYINKPREYINEHGGGLEKRYAIIQTMRELKELMLEFLKEMEIKNWDRVIIEDDVLYPPDTFEKLRKLAYFDNNIWMTTGVNYPKRDYGGLLAWTTLLDKPYKDAHSQVDVMKRSIVNLKTIDEKEYGYRELLATSTGFVYIKKEAEKDYIPNPLRQVTDDRGRILVNGQDMNLGWWITQTNKKIIMLDWSLKFPHLTESSPLKVYMSPFCKTNIYLECDDKIFGIVSHITSNINLEEMKLLHKIAGNLKNNLVIELGTHCGKSACIIADAIKNNNGIVICIDKFGKSKGWYNDEGIIYEDTLIEAKKNIKELGFKENILFIKDEFNSILPKLHTKAGLIFIDGDHHYQPIMENVRFAINNLDEDGIIAFHDYGSSKWTDVKKAVDECVLKYGLEKINQAGDLVVFKMRSENED